MNNITELPRAPLFGACHHDTQCPPSTASNHDEAHVIAAHPEQGWFLRCNGVVSFTDTADLYPDRHSDGPHRPDAPHRLVSA